MLFWLLKDVSWMVGSPYTWVISLTCAVILSVDFIYTTYATKVRCMYVCMYVQYVCTVHVFNTVSTYICLVARLCGNTYSTYINTYTHYTSMNSYIYSIHVCIQVYKYTYSTYLHTYTHTYAFI